MTRLRVLITCETLSGRGGTQLYVRDVAASLLRLGHTPIVYAYNGGEVAGEIRRMTVPVVDRLDALTTAPDLIYGQHHLPTMMALLRFCDVPAIYVCHDWYGENAFAPRFPRILRFIAIDVTCRDRLVYEDGIDESRVVMLTNSVDLNRFEQRPPLPTKPRRALVFGNYTKENPHLQALRTACGNRGIQLEVIGRGMNNTVDKPEETLKQYDLVFAKGRAALEALAVGTAVIIYAGISYLGPMVKEKDVGMLLPLNFGIRAMGNPLTPEELSQQAGDEIDSYDPVDAARATLLVRAQASQDIAMREVEEMCEEVVAEYKRTKGELDPRSEGPAAAAYLEQVMAQHSRLKLQHQRVNERTIIKLSDRLNRFPRVLGVLRSLSRPLTR